MGAQRGVEQMVFESVPVVQGKAAAKRLRLFGVNMECPISESEECDILSTTAAAATAAHPLHQLAPPLPLLQLRPSYGDDHHHQYHQHEEKGKASMSLDLDI